MACPPSFPLFLLRHRKFRRQNRNFQSRVTRSSNGTNSISSMSNSKRNWKPRNGSKERMFVRATTVGSGLSDQMPSRGILHRFTIARGYYARSVSRGRKLSTAVTTLRGMCLPALPTPVIQASFLLILGKWGEGGEGDHSDDELWICRHVTTAHPSISGGDERLLGCLSELYQGTGRRTSRKRSP